MIKKKGPFRGLTHYFFFFFFLSVFFFAYFLLAAARVFSPCLSFGFIQPQVAHITSSLPYKPYKYRRYMPSLTLPLTLGLCQNLAHPFSYHIHMLHTLYFLSVVGGFLCNLLRLLNELLAFLIAFSLSLVGRSLF